MIDVRFVPMPRPAKGLLYAKSQFKRGSAFYSRVFSLLETELKKLNAADVTIQAGFRHVDIKIDGWPRAAARPEHPGVRLQFRRSNNVFAFESLRYGTWEENVYAIALSMEALRAVSRYGVVNGEQYAGFKQLAAPAEPDDREAKLRNLAENGATEGERSAARAALERMKAGER